MSNDPLLPLSPDEALYAFMDGELATSDEQQLFNELASNKELRTELKDILSIRNAVLHDLVAPPAAAETGLVGAIGFQGAGAGVVGGGLATASGASVTGMGGWSALSSVLFTSSCLLAGVAVAWWLFGFSAHDKAPLNVASTASAPVMLGIAGEPGLHTTIIAPTDTIHDVRYVNRYRNTPTVTPVEQIPQQKRDIAEQTLQPLPATTIIAVSSPNNINNSLDQISSANTVSINLEDYSTPAVPHKAAFLATGLQSPPVSVRLRTLASGLRSSESVPTSVQNSLIPNTAFALLFPLNANHKIGVELGTESFRQEFSSTTADNRQLMVLQTPVLFWMGGTYQYNGDAFSGLGGISPFAIATLGYAYAQGPVGRATVGFSYKPVGPLCFSVGLDAALLGYNHQSNWFTTRKWGISYGLSIDLGAIK